MTSFGRGDVVLVPFPYTDRNVRYRRPSMVVTERALGGNRDLVWVVMVTSAANRRWPGDVPVEDGMREAGLVLPSVVRTAKIVNVDVDACVWLGRLPPSVITKVMDEIRLNLAS